MKIRRNTVYKIPEDWNKVKQQTYDFLLDRHRKIRRPYKAAVVLDRIVYMAYRKYKLSLLED